MTKDIIRRHESGEEEDDRPTHGEDPAEPIKHERGTQERSKEELQNKRGREKKIPIELRPQELRLHEDHLVNNRERNKKIHTKEHERRRVLNGPKRNEVCNDTTNKHPRNHEPFMLCKKIFQCAVPVRLFESGANHAHMISLGEERD